mgnify:CR=1 FL=1
MKRAGIFLFFDPQGLVDDYIVECLTSLREYLDEILVVSNSPLDDTARERLLKGATEVFEREIPLRRGRIPRRHRALRLGIASVRSTS